MEGFDSTCLWFCFIFYVNDFVGLGAVVGKVIFLVLWFKKL